MRCLALAMFPVLAFAGQSIRLTSGSGTWTQSARSDTLPYRVEFRMHNVGTGPGNQNAVIDTGGVSFHVIWNGGNGFWVGPTNRTIGTPCTISNVSSYGATGFVVRYQYDPSQGTYGKETCEVWDLAKTETQAGYYTASSQFYPAVLVNNSTTGTIAGETNGESSIDFLRVYSTLVTANSRPPLPADTDGDVTNFKFEGNLTGTPGAITLASPTYVSNPAAILRASVRVNNPSSGLTWISCRAGNGCSASAAGSFTTDDSSPTPGTYFWQQIGGPSTIRWSSRTSATPTMTGLMFGSYSIRLVVTSGGLTESQDFDFGVVATDSAGVVVHPSDDIASLFGPSIAFGQNPVAYATEKHNQAVTATYTRYLSNGYDVNPARAWKPGTVVYTYPNGASANLTNSPGTSGTALQFANLNAFDVTEFPFLVTLGITYTPTEIIVICSSSGGTTLNVCVGGRGSFGTAAANLASGNTIYQPRIKGTGTAFLTDMCAGGLGPTGRILYTSANVTATNGSATLINNVSWPAGMTGFVSIEGAGLDAVTGRWWAVVNSQSGTSLVMDKTYPGTTGTVTARVIVAYMSGSPLLERDTVELPKGTGVSPIEADLVHSWYGFCGTNTMSSYWGGGREVWGTFSITGAKYSTINFFGASNTFAENFYDEVFGLYSQYYSSGSKKALDAARALGDIWLTADEYGTSIGGSSYLGTIVNAVFDGRAQSAQMKKLRREYASSTWSSTYCTSGFIDQRTALGYGIIWQAALALLDPDNTARAAAAAKLQGIYDALVGCAGVDYSFRQGVFSGGEITGATATNASAVVTFPANWNTALCGYIGAGVARVDANKRTVTKQSGDNFDGPTNRLVVFRQVRSDGSSWPSTYTGSGTTVTIPIDYPYTTGVDVNYWVYDLTANGANYYPIGIRNETQTDYRNNYGGAFFCRSDSTSQITLDRPWPNATLSGTARVGATLSVGVTSQPVMVGLIATGMVYAEAAARKDGQTTLANNFRTLLKNTVDWLVAQDGSGGWNNSDKGVYYLRGGICDPSPAPLPATGVCNDALENNRINTTETLLGASMRYVWNSGTTVYRDAGDAVYRAIYNRTGDPTVWGIASDAYTPLSIFDFATPRYFTGNVIGMGYGSSWPAARLGGVAAAITRTHTLSMSRPAGAVDTQIEMTSPAGVTTTTVCATTTCSVTTDARQGNHLYVLRHRNGGGVAIAVSDRMEFASK